MPSIRYLISRTVQAVFTLVAVVSFTFFMIRWLPGGPQDYLLSQLVGQPNMTQDRIQLLMQDYLNYMPDAPLHVQYINYMTALLHGDLGTSIWYQKPVTGIIANAMPWTIYLSAVSLMFTFATGISLGAIMAYKEKSTFDTGMTLYTTVVHSFPYYLFALLILWVFSFTTGWFPIGGRMTPGVTPGFNLAFITDVVYHSALPILSLLVIGFGGAALGMRANSIRVLGNDYLRVARLRGLSDQRIALRYVARNAILPMYTTLMISIGSLFGGAIILETIFNYPGMGYYMFQAVSARDYPLMMGAFLFITIGVVVGIYLADLTYGWVDPRAGESDEHFVGGSPIKAVLNRFRRLRWRLQSDNANVSLHGNPTSAGTVVSDGAGADVAASTDSPFFARSDVKMSKTDRWKQSVDQQILTPFRIIWGDWRARFGFLVILLYLLMGAIAWVSASEWWILADVVFIRQPKALRYPTLVPPLQSLKYPLGTNDMGKSILAQLVHSTPAMLKMMVGGALYGTTLATVWGLFAGYVGGKVDRVMMSISDVLMTIPGLPLVIVVATILRPENPFVVGALITINGWAGAARVFRSQILTLRSSSYVEASRTMGLPIHRILSKDLLPELMPLIFLRFVSLAQSVISGSVALYFLGILPFTTLNWGVMLNLAYSSGTWYSLSSVHWILAPIVTIVLISVGLILFGQSLDQIFNPRIRTRHAKTSPDDIEENVEGR